MVIEGHFIGCPPRSEDNQLSSTPHLQEPRGWGGGGPFPDGEPVHWLRFLSSCRTGLYSPHSGERETLPDSPRDMPENFGGMGRLFQTQMAVT